MITITSVKDAIIKKANELYKRAFFTVHTVHRAEETPKQPPLRIDVDRMRGALSSKRFELPSGLSVDEIRLHIIESTNYL